jgi:transposase
VGIDLADHSLFDKSIGTETIKLKQSDMLVIYTDGITEAMDSEGGQFGEERLLKVIKKHGHLTPQEFADKLDEEIAAFTSGEPQNDDITLVAIKERAVADDIIYDVRKRLIDLVEKEGVPVNEACEIMKLSPSTYYRYRRRVREFGDAGLRDKIPRALEKLGRVSLEAQQQILKIVKETPSYGPTRISRELKRDECGGMDVPPRKVYACLRRMNLSTKEQRKKLALEGRTKIMNLDTKSRKAEVPEHGETQIESTETEEIVNQDESCGLNAEEQNPQAGQEQEETYSGTRFPPAKEEIK